MKLIVAVYDDWGIGKDGTQPLTLNADRAFFKKITCGAMIIAGRRTIEDFPGKRPLPNRQNVVLTKGANGIPGFIVCNSINEATELARNSKDAFVIGGGSVFLQMLPMCDMAYVTKVHCTPLSDTFFPNLDLDAEWEMKETIQSGTENGISYDIYLYSRKELKGNT